MPFVGWLFFTLPLNIFPQSFSIFLFDSAKRWQRFFFFFFSCEELTEVLLEDFCVTSGEEDLDLNPHKHEDLILFFREQ